MCCRCASRREGRREQRDCQAVYQPNRVALWSPGPLVAILVRFQLPMAFDIQPEARAG